MKNNFLPIINVWSQTAISEKIVLIKQLVNIEFSLPSSSTTASRSKHNFGDIASHSRVLILPGCLNDTSIIVNSEHLTG